RERHSVPAVGRGAVRQRRQRAGRRRDHRPHRPAEIRRQMTAKGASRPRSRTLSTGPGERKPQTLRELAATKPAARAAIPDVIAEAIREAVATGILEQGTPLRQNDIASDFGVSSIPVREALRRLEALGFVEALPNRGFIVSRISIEEIQ